MILDSFVNKRNFYYICLVKLFFVDNDLVKLYFLHNTSVLSFYVDVVLTLSTSDVNLASLGLHQEEL